MNSGKYILVNGAFVLADEYRISLQESEAFLFSEKIRAVRTSFPFFTETLELIKHKLDIFNRSFPEFTDREGAGLKRQLERTLTKNKFFLGAAFVITFRYLEDKVQYSIQAAKLDYADYELNEKGLFVGLSDAIRKPFSAISHLSLGSEIYWDIALNSLDYEVCDQPLIVNQNGWVIEAPESNIYLIKGKKVRGAADTHGAFVDITRLAMLDIFRKLDMVYTETEGITTDDMYLAEEVLLVNSVDGIRWVAGFEGKRYFKHAIRKMNELFNAGLVH